MMRIYCAIVGIVLLAAALSGCAAVLVGAGAAGGYAVSRDTVQSDVDKTYGDVWSSAAATLKDMGTVIVEDKVRGKLEAIVEKAHVWVTVKEITAKTTQLKVKARKDWLPKIELAHKISVRILEK